MIDKSQVLERPAPVEVPPPPPPAPDLLRLDLGCGQSKRDGFRGVDIARAPGVDVVHDLLSYPWPFEDESVDEIYCSHFLEHVPGPKRGRFMDEVYRILKFESFATFVTPYWTSERAIQDYTHAWPPVGSASYYYFCKAWREANKLTHGAYAIRCDFDVEFPGQALDNMWAQRHPEALMFGAKHYNNVVLDLIARLVKRKRQ